jgi:hypothetical protein
VPGAGMPAGSRGAGVRHALQSEMALRASTPHQRGGDWRQVMPRCRRCGMQVAWSAIGTPAHEGSKTCRCMAAQRAQHQTAAAGMRAAGLRFTAYGTDELRNVDRFKYLGRVLSYDENDVPAMRRNLKKARATWGRVSKILTREEVPAPVSGMFYQAVVAAMLLYGSESWFFPPSGLKVLEEFHVEAARRMTGMRPQRRTVGPWVYPKSRDVLAAARLQPVATYIRRRRHNIAKTIEGRTLLEECRGGGKETRQPSQNFLVGPGNEPGWRRRRHPVPRVGQATCAADGPIAE